LGLFLASFTHDSPLLFSSVPSVVKELFEKDGSCPVFAVQNANKKTFSLFLRRQCGFFPESCQNRPLFFATLATTERGFGPAEGWTLPLVCFEFRH
jgi:hypothetical protein